MKAGSNPIKLRMIRILHPLLVFALLFMIYLRISFPFVFFLLISVSPVIICTAVLLGGLLALGQQQAKGTQNYAYKSHKFSSSRQYYTTQINGMISPKKGGGGDGDGGCFRDKFAEVRNDIVEKEMKEPRRDNSIDDKIQERKFPKTVVKKKLIDEPRREDHSSSFSPSSSSESDARIESSRVYVPKICNYHPLLENAKEENEVSSIVEEIHELSSSDNENKQHLEELIQDRSHDYEIDVNYDEEDEHNDSEDDDEDDEEDQNVEQDGIKAVVTWTEEDEKNLKDLSRLELERNRQLERIMSRRIAQKTYSTITEKSVMDLDTSDLPFTIAPISTTKTNPFEFSYSTREMSPVPASAPAFFPRRNPFDDLDTAAAATTTITKHISMNVPVSNYHQHENRSEHAHMEKDSGDFPNDSSEASKREALFRRYQSFGVVGSSFYGFLWQENEHESLNMFNPYFAPHKSHHSSQGSTSDQGSSSSTDAVEDQEEEVSESSSEINLKHSDVEDDGMKVEGGSSSHIENVEPVYDSYDTSPSAAGKNILLSSESSDMQEGKSEI